MVVIVPINSIHDTAHQYVHWNAGSAIAHICKFELELPCGTGKIRSGHRKIPEYGRPIRNNAETKILLQ